jgi:hypothetical protein
MSEQWQPIATAPKDGTRVLGYGMAYKNLAINGESWLCHNTEDGRLPFICVVWWKEAWYDDEIELGDGLYRKEPKLSFASWYPHTHAFNITHWMPLPEPPAEGASTLA